MENLVSQGVTLMVIGMATVFAFGVINWSDESFSCIFKKFADRYTEPETPVKVSGGGDVEGCGCYSGNTRKTRLRKEGVDQWLKKQFIL